MDLARFCFRQPGVYLIPAEHLTDRGLSDAFAEALGIALYPAADHRVALAAPTSGYGNYTCIQHTSVMSTCYAHQSVFKVSVGQSVRQGQVIGLSGCTGLCFGDHLHFEVRLNGTVTNPMDYL